MVRLPVRSHHTAKDQKKADLSNKFIGRGSANSSTNAYRIAYGSAANSGQYSAYDVVFISAEGNRNNRLDPDFDEIHRAAMKSVIFITDDAANRNRLYNLGERQVAEFLLRIGYVEVLPGVWGKA